MKQTLLLVFIHGFKGTDDTFANFPSDLRALLAHSLPLIDVRSVQYPRYETRGDLQECVSRFRDWLQNYVIDLEVANETPSPTVEPSVHVVLCGHSMGGIVAAETLLSIALEETVHTSSYQAGNSTASSTQGDDLPSSAPAVDATKLLFPYITGIIAFDTPYLGISPGVLAHGAEEHINHASSAYKAFDSASSFFGWGGSSSGGANAASQPIPNAANRALPAAGNASTSTSAWNKWGKYAALGGAAAAVAGAAGAAYVNRNQIKSGFAWAGSHLEFVGCLARGAELQQRVEKVVGLTRSHGVGFADFYTALEEKKTQGRNSPSGSILGRAGDGKRTFCVVPKSARAGEIEASSPSTTRRSQASASQPQAPSTEEMQNGEQVANFANDTSKSKGHWVKCVNSAASDELTAHTSMFSPKTNSNYHSMLPSARDEIVEWIDRGWYERSSREEANTVGGGEGGSE